MKNIVELPVTYTAEILPRRGRKVRMVNVTELHPFEIEDYSDNIPPVVAIIEDMESIRKVDDTYIYPVRNKNVSIDDVWNKVTQMQPDEEDYHLLWDKYATRRASLKDLTQGTLENGTYNINAINKILTCLTDEALINTGEKNNIADYDVKTYISDNKQFVINKVQKELANYSLINDQLYQNTKAEPVVCVYPPNLHIFNATDNRSDIHVDLSLKMLPFLTKTSSVYVLDPEAFSDPDENDISLSFIKFIEYNIDLFEVLYKGKITDVKKLYASTKDDIETLKILHQDGSLTFQHVKELSSSLNNILDVIPQSYLKSASLCQLEPLLEPDKFLIKSLNELDTLLNNFPSPKL